MEKILQYDDIIDIKKSKNLIKARLKEIRSFTLVPSIKEQKNWFDCYLIQMALPIKKFEL
jgi:hypothetical protein